MVRQRRDGSDGENTNGVFAQAGNCTADEAASGLGGDAQVLADFAEALALTVDETEAGLDGVASTLVEGAEQFVEEVAVPGSFQLSGSRWIRCDSRQSTVG